MSWSRAKHLIGGEDETKKPFKIGQLARRRNKKARDPYKGLFLVLNNKWDNDRQRWVSLVLSQRNGYMAWHWSGYYELVEENDE